MSTLQRRRRENLQYAKVRKEFTEGFFNGTIMYRKPSLGLYHVKYEDDDSEDM